MMSHHVEIGTKKVSKKRKQTSTDDLLHVGVNRVQNAAHLDIMSQLDDQNRLGEGL